MSDPGAFGVAAAEEHEGGEAPPLAGAGVSTARKDVRFLQHIKCPLLLLAAERA